MFNLNVSLNGGIDKTGSEVDILIHLLQEGSDSLSEKFKDDEDLAWGSARQYAVVLQKILNNLP